MMFDELNRSNIKRAWEIGKQPITANIPFVFMLWMFPDQPSIFTLAIVWMAFSNPIFSIFSINQGTSKVRDVAFVNSLAFASIQIEAKNSHKLWPAKLLFLGLNIGAILWACRKLSRMGLLPVDDADWIAFYRVAPVCFFFLPLFLADC
jgi:hypothetical protein